MSYKNKVLFIAKEKLNNKFSILVQRQIYSLNHYNNSLKIDSFQFNGKGVLGYFNSYIKLKTYLRKNDFPMIHAHYSIIGTLTLLARKKEKVVVSFMGSDVYFNGILFKLARRYVLKKADHIIVKSERLKEKLTDQNNISVIPNGVNLKLFRPMDKKEAQKQLSLSKDRIHILFPSTKKRYEKNFKLAENAVNIIAKRHKVKIHFLVGVEPQDIPTFLNAADLLLITSRWEGSSNITKEAMACNTVVVSTDVGDTSELFDNAPGYFISKHESIDIASKLEIAIDFIKKDIQPTGRERILDLKLDDSLIAERILNIYNQVLKN